VTGLREVEDFVPRERAKAPWTQFSHICGGNDGRDG
jgi:hypothetical protein